ncbi:hypothetical protein LTR62_004599 [Meristemomyces frigidus]|uniref:Uncharacterized protein n=1 Tax=Meristemomyces frigidus TaxID=1508187 RepID=A0AAN7TEA9_9PEZI|nr:hypothetical protein LTR62_004599 [Meristemomyces frigidus]
MSHYITTHNSSGHSTFSSSVPTSPHPIQIPGGTMSILYSTHASPPSLNTETDITQYSHDRTNGFDNGALCPPSGTAAAIITFAPDAVSAVHRTLTLDFMVIVEGVVELYLESGEVRIMRAGDSVVQRGTMHWWKNVSPHGGVGEGDGYVHSVAIDIAKPFQVAGRTMETEFRM